MRRRPGGERSRADVEEETGREEGRRPGGGRGRRSVERTGADLDLEVAAGCEEERRQGGGCQPAGRRTWD